jgi:hypothetical protein
LARSERKSGKREAGKLRRAERSASLCVVEARNRRHTHGAYQNDQPQGGETHPGAQNETREDIHVEGGGNSLSHAEDEGDEAHFDAEGAQAHLGCEEGHKFAWLLQSAESILRGTP